MHLTFVDVKIEAPLRAVAVLNANAAGEAREPIEVHDLRARRRGRHWRRRGVSRAKNRNIQTKEGTEDKLHTNVA